MSRIYEMTGTNVSCTNGYSSSNQNTIETNYKVQNVIDGGETFSVSAGKCGQIDAVGFCGSCRPGCGTTIVTPSPTPTPTGVQPCCTNLTIAKVLADGTTGPLTDLQVGDSIRATITFSGTVENVAVRLKRGGVKVLDKLAGGSKTNTWSADFTISAAGEYEILGFVKVGGIWK